MMPVFEKMLDNVSNCGSREPNTCHAAARTSFCKNTWGGSDVASDTKAASRLKAAIGIVHLSGIFTLPNRKHPCGCIISDRGRKVSHKGETRPRAARFDRSPRSPGRFCSRHLPYPALAGG